MNFFSSRPARRAGAAPLLALSLLLITSQAQAQTHDKYGLLRPDKPHYDSKGRMYFRGPLRATFGLGVGYYSGDLTSKVSENFIRPAVSLGLLYRLGPHFTAITELSYVELSAYDHLPERNLAFFGRNGVATALLRYYPLPDPSAFAGARTEPRRVSPFVQAGVGLLLYSPTASLYNGGVPSSNTTLPRERNDYPSFTGILPVGAGITVTATPRINVTVEANYYFTNTDSIDDVKYRGNPDNNDAFGTGMVKLEYLL